MENKQISTKQFVCVQFLIALAIKMFMLPALMLRIIGKDSYIVMLIWIGVETVNLTFVLLLARRNPDKTMFDILGEAFGKVVSRIIVGMLALFALAKSVLIVGELKMFFSITMYDEINWTIMALPLMALLAAFAIRSLRATGRTSEIVAPFVLVCTLILGGLIIGDMQGDDLLPFLEDGFSPVAKGITMFPMWFGDITVLLLFVGNIKIGRGFFIASYAAKLLAGAAVMLFSCTLFATYANINTLIDYGHNISNMSQFSMGSQDYGRFDLIFYCVWLLSVFIKLATVFMLAERSVEFIAGGGNRYVITLCCVAALYILSEFVLGNQNTLFQFATGAAKYVVVPPAVIAPLLLYVTALVKYKPNRASKKGERKDEDKNSEEQDTSA